MPTQEGGIVQYLCEAAAMHNLEVSEAAGATGTKEMSTD
jgi:hypothetical protein